MAVFTMAWLGNLFVSVQAASWAQREETKMMDTFKIHIINETKRKMLLKKQLPRIKKTDKQDLKFIAE